MTSALARRPRISVICGRRRWRAAAGVLAVSGCAFVLAPSRLTGQSPLLSLPLHDPAYAQLDGLARQGCPSALVSSYRPYRIEDVRSAVVAASEDSRCTGAILRSLRARFVPDTATPVRPDTVPGLVTIEGTPYDAGPPRPSPWRAGGTLTVEATALQRGEFLPLWLDVRSRNEGDPPLLGLARGRLSWDGGPHVAAVAELVAQSHIRNDPQFRTARLRTTSGGVQFSEAYVAGRVGRLSLSFGRQHEVWLGEGRESLLLSAHGPALDRLAAALTYPKLETRALIAMVDDVELSTELDGLPPEESPRRLYRFLVGHALTWRPSTRVFLSLGETALLSRTSPVLDLSYANPLMIYLVTQEDRSVKETGRQDNLMIFAALGARLGRTTLNARLLIDDLQIDAADRKITPDQLGWELQVTSPIQLAFPVSVGASYRRLDSFTYLREFYAAVYQHYDSPLGSSLGPDADLLRGEAELWLGGEVRIHGSLAWWRRGAQRIDARPSEGAAGHAGEPFPSATLLRSRTQRALLGELGIQLLGSTLPVSVRIETAQIDNANNRPVGAAFYMRAQLQATYVFRYP